MRDIHRGARDARHRPPEEERRLALARREPGHRARGQENAKRRHAAAAEPIGRNAPGHLEERVRVEE